MVKLSQAAKDQILAEWMRSGDFPPSMTKPELRDVIDTADTRQNGMNGVWPAKMKKIHKQKLFTRVAAKREGV